MAQQKLAAGIGDTHSQSSIGSTHDGPALPGAGYDLLIRRGHLQEVPPIELQRYC